MASAAPATAPAAKRKKGLSLEEKREIMLNICLESKEVFNLKDLERLGSKAGVVSQTIKDVVQSLVDDRLIEVDKIGSGNFFWAFPSTAFMSLKTRAEGLESAVANETAVVASMKAKIAEASAGREEGADRTSKLTTLAALKAEKEELEKVLKLHAESDPEALMEMEGKVKRAKEAADRWTDNVWTLKSHLTEKYGKMASEVDALMGIPEDFDYLS